MDRPRLALWSASTGDSPIAVLSADPIPTYSVSELNVAIGSLLERGFAPRFIVEATVSRPQQKKGHLWLTLTDQEASISAVVWASKLKQLSHRPADGDGVTVIGKLNFWAARASLNVQVIDIRPSLTTVMRQFERVRNRLMEDRVIDELRRRPLPQTPAVVAILTSVPSSALADMLRTAKERWPQTKLLVIPIPVQGLVAPQIRAVLQTLADQHKEMTLDALVLARGGGSREDLAVFDDEDLCRDLARFPKPVITGLGHEDDLTVADLVADHRAATPTAAIVALLPDRGEARRALQQRRQRLHEQYKWCLMRCRQQLEDRRRQWVHLTPSARLERLNRELTQRRRLLEALSPQRWLKRGLALVSDPDGQSITDTSRVKSGDSLNIELSDGRLDVRVERIHPSSSTMAS